MANIGKQSTLFLIRRLSFFFRSFGLVPRQLQILDTPDPLIFVAGKIKATQSNRPLISTIRSTLALTKINGSASFISPSAKRITRLLTVATNPYLNPQIPQKMPPIPIEKGRLPPRPCHYLYAVSISSISRQNTLASFPCQFSLPRPDLSPTVPG